MPKQTTPDLTGKLNWLLKSQRAQGVARRVTGREVQSYPTLAEACDVAASNFKPTSGVLTDRMALKLRWVYGIDVDAEDGKDCWDEFEVGSLEDFSQAYQQLHPELRYVIVPIEDRIGSIDGPSERVYVRVALRRQDHDPANPTFDGELVCQVFTRIGVRLAVRRGTLKVECRKELVPPITARLGGNDGGVVRMKRGNREITVTPGGIDHMNWEIDTSVPPIGVVAADLEGLFRLTGLRDGDTFDVSFVVEDDDLEADHPEAAQGALQEVQSEGADPAIVAATGAPLGIAKRQLMAHIAKHSLGLFGHQHRGKAILCRYAFRVAIERREHQA